MEQANSGIFALYKVEKVKKKLLIATWIGVDQFDGLTGKMKLRKNGNHKFFMNDQEKHRINLENWTPLHRRWKKMRRSTSTDGDSDGSIFFDSTTDVLSVSESNCMWSSDWILPLILKDQNFLEDNLSRGNDLNGI